MSISDRSINNPLALIAVLAATTEASALASLPLLDYRNQNVFVWFLVGFPPFLTVLFFITLNFNRKALASTAQPREPGWPYATAGSPLHAAASADLPPEQAPAAGTRALEEEYPRQPPLAQLQVMQYSNDNEWQRLSPLLHAWAQTTLSEGPRDEPIGLMLVKRT